MRESLETQAVIAQSEALRASLPPKASRALTDLVTLIEELSASMQTAASELQFEVAARYRDEITDLRRELRAMKEAGA